MGVVDTISFERYPKQGSQLNARVTVCFNYDTSKRISGRIVRDDHEAPHRTIIALCDGRYVLATECQYSMRPMGRDEARAHGSKPAPPPVPVWEKEAP